MTDRVRVVHVLEALEGGTARHLVDVVRHATQTDHEVVVPPTRVDGITDEAAIGHMEAAGARVHLLPMRRKPYAPSNAAGVARLVRLLRERRPDVVHGHSGIGGVLARLAGAGARLPRVYTPNGVTDVRGGLLVERALARLTTRFVATSPSEGELAVGHRIVAADRVVVIPNGVELELPPAVDLRSRLGLGPDVPLVGSVARLAPQKAPEIFVAACEVAGREVPDAHFVLVGGGPQQAEVDELAAASPLGPRLHLLRSLPGAAGALGDLDVFALSSRYEGGPYAPLEAMRAGTAVVLTDCVGNRDTVVDGESGLLVPVEDASALGAAIAALLTDPARRARLADAGRARVAACFDVRAMGAALDDLYRELARGR